MSSILIVEDDVLAGEYLEFVLREAGYEATPAGSAEEAILVLERSDDIHLVVTDISTTLADLFTPLWAYAFLQHCRHGGQCRLRWRPVEPSHRRIGRSATTAAMPVLQKMDLQRRGMEGPPSPGPML